MKHPLREKQSQKRRRKKHGEEEDEEEEEEEDLTTDYTARATPGTQMNEMASLL